MGAVETGHISDSFSIVSAETIADIGSIDLVHTYRRYENCLGSPKRCLTDCAWLKLWFSSISDTPFVCLAAQLSEFPRWTSSCVKHAATCPAQPGDYFHLTSSHVAWSSSDTRSSSFALSSKRARFYSAELPGRRLVQFLSTKLRQTSRSLGPSFTSHPCGIVIPCGQSECCPRLLTRTRNCCVVSSNGFVTETPSGNKNSSR